MTYADFACQVSAAWHKEQDGVSTNQRRANALRQLLVANRDLVSDMRAAQMGDRRRVTDHTAVRALLARGLAAVIVLGIELGVGESVIYTVPLSAVWEEQDPVATNPQTGALALRTMIRHMACIQRVMQAGTEASAVIVELSEMHQGFRPQRYGAGELWQEFVTLADAWTEYSGLTLVAPATAAVTMLAANAESEVRA